MKYVSNDFHYLNNDIKDKQNVLHNSKPAVDSAAQAN